jgi:hypothetical protein
VTPAALEAFAADWTGPEIDSKGDTLFVTFTDNNTPPGPAYVVRSVDGGMSFADTVRVPLMGDEIPRFPTVTVMPDGNPLIALMRFTGSFDDPVNVVSLSSDGGDSFPLYTNATGIIPGEPCDCCPITVVANGNVAAVLYRNNDANIRDTWAALSYDNASTFNSSARLDSSNWMIMGCPSSGPDGYLYGDTLVSVFMNGADGMNKIYLGALDYVTGQVRPQQPVTPFASEGQNFPRIAGVGDTLGIVWRQHVDGVPEVFFTHSFNGPDGIGAVVDTLTDALSGAQGYPDIAYGGGKFHVVFESAADGKVYYTSAALPQDTLSTAAVVSGAHVKMYHADEKLRLLIGESFGDGRVAIYDAQGRLSLETKVASLRRNGFVIDTRFLCSGLYIVALITDGFTSVQKISIAR